MPKILTLRLKENESNELDTLIESHLTEINTASKALIYCMQRYPILMSCIDDLNQEVKQLKIDNAHYFKLVDDARTACALVVDKTSQIEI